jgi:hypothetical protein
LTTKSRWLVDTFLSLDFVKCKVIKHHTCVQCFPIPLLEKSLPSQNTLTIF